MFMRHSLHPKYQVSVASGGCEKSQKWHKWLVLLLESKLCNSVFFQFCHPPMNEHNYSLIWLLRGVLFLFSTARWTNTNNLFSSRDIKQDIPEQLYRYIFLPLHEGMDKKIKFIFKNRKTSKILSTSQSKWIKQQKYWRNYIKSLLI